MAESKAERRERFASVEADGIARHAGVTAGRVPRRRGWTTVAVWYEDADRLTAVVGSHEGKAAGLALAHGICLAAGRELQLILPEGLEGPSVFRAPWLKHRITVSTHGSSGVRPVTLPTRDETSAAAGGREKAPELHLGDSPAGIRELAEWAALHPNLEAAHRRDVRAWTCQGMRVLSMRRTRQGVAITAGIDASNTPAYHHMWTTSTPHEELARIKDAVKRGIVDAQNSVHGPYEEHHLQEVLRSQPHLLGLEHPVLREVPAFRPSVDSKPGRGFIDLLGLDGHGDLVIVETKLGGDDMLVLQGLDYWIWAHAKKNGKWLRARLHADPVRSQLKLLYAVGGRQGAPPALNRYAQAQFDALHPSVDWRLALIKNWKTGTSDVQLLPPKTRT